MSLVSLSKGFARKDNRAAIGLALRTGSIFGKCRHQQSLPQGQEALQMNHVRRSLLLICCR